MKINGRNTFKPRLNSQFAKYCVGISSRCEGQDTGRQAEVLVLIGPELSSGTAGGEGRDDEDSNTLSQL